MVVAALFLLSLFFYPLAGAVPAYATAPALVFVAVLMVKGFAEIAWDDLTEAAPALLTALAIPFTFSIAAGIGIGFIAYVAIKLVSGRVRDNQLGGGDHCPGLRGEDRAGLARVVQSMPPNSMSWPANAGHPGDACSSFGEEALRQTCRHSAEPNWVAVRTLSLANSRAMTALLAIPTFNLF